MTIISAFLVPPSTLSFLLFFESLEPLGLFVVVGFFAPAIKLEKNIPLINDEYILIIYFKFLGTNFYKFLLILNGIFPFYNLIMLYRFF